MECKYVSKIADDKVFDELESEYDISFPKELIDFIKKYNAGIPEKCRVKVGNTERTVGGFLSYNRDEEDADSAFTALYVLQGKGLIPFAADPFGNYFCYKDGNVVFWRHEEDGEDDTSMDLDGFVKALY